MKYTIEWSEKKTTSAGKDKMDATLKDQVTGITTQNVSIWQDFPGFRELMTGSTVEGDLIPAKDPKYGPSLSPLKKTTQWGMSKPYAKSGAVSALMDKKNENIKEAQERKSESIAYFNSVNSAISMMKTMDFADNERCKEKIIYWRDWFISEYDKWNSQPF